MSNLFSALTRSAQQKSQLVPVDGRGGWWPTVREPFTGAWQQNEEWHVDSVLAYPPVYACVTLIASDIAKLLPGVVERDSDGIWVERESHRYTRLLRRPNSYQNYIQFFEWWIVSKLTRGNTYVLIQRDSAGVAVRFFVLEPSRVQPLITDAGDVYYRLSADGLSGVAEDVTVPASEIIHDRINPLFHPLVGVSPLFACGESAAAGLRILKDSSKFFANGSNPGGVLTAPGAISEDTATRLKAHWDANYTGDKAGKVAVLGDGLKFEPMRMSAVDAQLIEQSKWSAEAVCSALHVPAYKVGYAQPPGNSNVEALTQDYYSQCLQIHIESAEACLDDALGLGDGVGIEFSLDGLLRMDSKTKMETLGIGVEKKLLTFNDGRKKLNLRPVQGGSTIYMQQQDFSLAAIHARDQGDPLSTPQPADTLPAVTDQEEIEDQARMFALILQKEMASAEHA